MLISVIIPSFNSQNKLVRLLDSLMDQHHVDCEYIIVDDCSTDDTQWIVKDYNVKYIRLEKNSGPAVCRNMGVEAANGDIIAFVDSDCRVDRNWLRNIEAHFTGSGIDSIMGRLIIDRSDYLGDSISSLGFPAGGSVGFEKIWKVDRNGFTNSLSSCNCAIRKEVFKQVGGFDETFPFAGGEDSFLAYSLVNSGFMIKYCPDIIVYHEARNSLQEYVSWQFKRGISSYIFSTKVKNRSDYIALRFWSISNVLKKNLTNKKMPLVLFLLLIGYFTQSLGFLYGKKRSRI